MKQILIITGNAQHDNVLNFLLRQELFATQKDLLYHTQWKPSQLERVLATMEAKKLIKCPTPHTIKLRNIDAELPAFHSRQFFLDGGPSMKALRRIERFLKFYGLDTVKLCDEFLSEYDLGDFYYVAGETILWWYHRNTDALVGEFSFIQKRRQP